MTTIDWINRYRWQAGFQSFYVLSTVPCANFYYN